MQGRAFCCCYRKLKGAWIAPLVEQQTCEQRVVGSVPSGSGGRFFFSRVIFLCWLLFHVCSTSAFVTTVAHKRPWSFCQKSAGGRLRINRHAHFTQWGWMGWLCCPGIAQESIRENGLPHKLIRERLSSHLGLASHHGLILAHKLISAFFFKAHAGNDSLRF